jgi:DNA-directed RNA polymerase I subunit RPA2
MDVPDSYIYDQLTVGLEEDLYYKDRIASMLQLVQKEGLHSQEQVRNYIGRSFKLKMDLPDWWSDEQICAYLLRRAVCIHLNSDEEKFHLVIFMTRKLFAYAQGKCAVEGMDPVMVQEVSLPGHTYLQLLKDRLTNWLNILKSIVLKKQRLGTTGARASQSFQMTQGVMGSAIQTCPRLDQVFESFLSTGNAPAMADLGLMQESGLSIMAENINRMRYMSHFRSVHRGASFMDSRSSEVRQLKSDAWGFLCPVHTPDGGPCGLLNHMSSTCQVKQSFKKHC